LLIDKAIQMTNSEDQEAAIIYIGRLMKRFYASWNKENIDDEVIVDHLTSMSGNKLKIDLQKVRSQNLFDSPKEKEYRPQNNGGGNHSGNNNHGQRKMKRPQDKRKRN
jgi:hypothetical protein